MVCRFVGLIDILIGTRLLHNKNRIAEPEDLVQLVARQVCVFFSHKFHSAHAFPAQHSIVPPHFPVSLPPATAASPLTNT